MLKTLIAAAIAVVCFATLASAETRIDGDPGGEVSTYMQKYDGIRASGERIVIDGPCASACTLLTGLVPTREGTQMVKRLYPASVRSWIDKHGGLTQKLIVMRGADLQRLYAPCR